MLNEKKELNKLVEQEIYFCYWDDNSHCIDDVTDPYMFELADELTKNIIEGELMMQHHNI